jgi:hypothetical protein
MKSPKPWPARSCCSRAGRSVKQIFSLHQEYENCQVAARGSSKSQASVIVPYRLDWLARRNCSARSPLPREVFARTSTKIDKTAIAQRCQASTIQAAENSGARTRYCGDAGTSIVLRYCLQWNKGVGGGRLHLLQRHLVGQVLGSRRTGHKKSRANNNLDSKQHSRELGTEKIKICRANDLGGAGDYLRQLLLPPALRFVALATSRFQRFPNRRYLPDSQHAETSPSGLSGGKAIRLNPLGGSIGKKMQASSDLSARSCRSAPSSAKAAGKHGSQLGRPSLCIGQKHS